LPILGLPDCESAPDNPIGEAYGEMGGRMYEQLKEAGVPVPESYSATALTGVEETTAVHMMAMKLGGIGITVCPCEQFTDTALNIESRIDKTAENLWLGWNWADRQTPSGRDWCVQNEDGTWTCADPRNPNRDLAPVSDLAYRRMVAQIENDARGWEADLATLGSEAEPHDPAAIKGNFTHEEFPEHGFDLPIAVGMGNDYWGYVPEYREYRSHDHYRKALSGLGPHGADFLATRLARMAVSLNGGPGPEIRPIDLAYQAESGRAQVVAEGLGELADAYEQVYSATLPADGGDPKIESQPQVVERFSAAELTWTGGSTYGPMPVVTVERRDGERWVPYADTSGEIQLKVRFPRPEELAGWRAGTFEWLWTATFEAFGSDITLPDASGEPRTVTPAGTYRFVVQGQHRSGPPAALADYELTSDPFEVKPWSGITVDDIRLEPNGTVSFGVGPVNTYSYEGGKTEVLGPVDLPDSYASPFRYISNERRVFTYGSSDPSRHQVYCSFCSFRPWADTAEVASASVTIRRANGRTEVVPATYDAVSGRWSTAAALKPNESAWVETGGVLDDFGDFNGNRSAVVERRPGT
ncbi:MAG TPA: hypothetical protein VFS18_01850, partial [Actinomycetota bacterium]|nr:hypothetical protein [Actinomycetota bacterium]